MPSLALPEEEDDSAFVEVVLPVMIACVGCLVVAGMAGYCVLRDARPNFKDSEFDEFDNVQLDASALCDDILMGGSMADGLPSRDKYGSVREFLL